MFEAIKPLTNKRSQRLNVIKDEDDHVLTESKDIQDWWKRYCENLSAKDDRIQHEHTVFRDYQDEPDIMFSEIKAAVKKLKS